MTFFEGGEDQAFRALIEIQRGQVELARARRCEANGETPKAHGLRKSIEQRLARVMKESMTAGTRGTRSFWDSSWAARLLVRLLSAELNRRPSLRICRTGRAFRVGERSMVDLDHHPVSRRVLRALAETRIRSPGQSLSMEELLELGWPGEKILPDVQKVRVRNVIHRLRRAGLDGVLLQADGGYVLDARCPMELVDDEMSVYS